MKRPKTTNESSCSIIIWINLAFVLCEKSTLYFTINQFETFLLSFFRIKDRSCGIRLVSHWYHAFFSKFSSKGNVCARLYNFDIPTAISVSYLNHI